MSQKRKSGVCTAVLLNRKASMTDAEATCFNEYLGPCLAGEPFITEGGEGWWPCAGPLEGLLGGSLTLEAQFLFKSTLCLHPRAYVYHP